MTKRILVIDDHEDSLKIFTRLIAREGYEVILANDGHEGLRKIGRYLPDLILLDVNLPGIDGFEIFRAIKSSSALCSIPVLMITAGIDPVLQEQSLNTGAEEFLCKPIRSSDLMAKIRRYLDERRPSSFARNAPFFS